MTDVAAANSVNAYFPEFVERVKNLAAAANEWLKKLDGKGIQDEETARRANDFVGQLKKEARAIEDERLKQVRPILQERDLINSKAQDVAAPIVAALSLLAPLERAWLQELRRRQDEERNRRAEEARKAQEEQERLAREAAKASTVESVVALEVAGKRAEQARAALDASMAAKPQVKGDFVARATGLRTMWSARIDDLPAATAHYLKTPAGQVKIRDVIQQLASADARTVKAEAFGVPGCVGVMEER